MSGFAVEVERLTKRYHAGRENAIVALGGIDLAIHAGTVAAVTGPSGSGKSTLLHLVGAMDTADSGRILVAGREVTALSAREQVDYRRTIGFVFQRFHLLAALTVLDNVMAPLLPRRQSFDLAERARELLGAVGLSDRERAVPSQLSGGQQQRVAIARALINRPGLLLADEPTGNLDSRTGKEIIDLLLDLRDRLGMTILIATHDASVADRSDRIIQLHDGQLTDGLDMDSASTLECSYDEIEPRR